MDDRAVTYNRCSSEEEAQADALKKQVQESAECVAAMGWTLVDTYVEAKSGTSTKGRSEYNRLFADLESNKFDIVVIKSQDRLMRNVKDWYLFLDRLLTNDKKLYIYIEHKFYTADDALITGIKAILAEDYSRELSKKSNNAHRSRQKNKSSFVLTSRIYGYDRTTDRKIVINEEEAEAIRKMYTYCAMGYGSRSIANMLYNEGFRNRNGKRLTDASVRRLIRSKLPMGTVVMNRFHYDFNSKRTIKLPESEHIVVPNALPAIVDEELWNRANQKMDQRAVLEKKNGRHVKGSNPGKYQLSGKLVCGFCQSPYYRCVRPTAQTAGKTVADWRCAKYVTEGRQKKSAKGARKVSVKSGGCDNIHLEETKLFRVLEEVSERYYESYQLNKESIIDETVSLLQSVFLHKDETGKQQRAEAAKEKYLHQKDILMEKLLEGVIGNTDYQRKVKQLDEQLDTLEEELMEIEKRKHEAELVSDRIRQIKERLEEEGVKRATVYEMLESVEKIKVYPDHLMIEFDKNKMIGLETETLEFLIEETESNSNFVMAIPLGSTFDRAAVIEEQRKSIIKKLRENPTTTARMLAGELNISLSTANMRLKDLKKRGSIRFVGAGGHGYWEVLDISGN